MKLPGIVKKKITQKYEPVKLAGLVILGILLLFLTGAAVTHAR